MDGDGEGDEKKREECLVVWGFICIFAARFEVMRGAEGGAMASRYTGQEGARWGAMASRQTGQEGRKERDS